MSDRSGLSAATAPDAVDDLPPSAKLVVTVLAREGELTQSQLASETLLPARTVRYATTKLEERDLVESRISFADARQQLHSLDEERFGTPDERSSR